MSLFHRNPLKFPFQGKSCQNLTDAALIWVFETQDQVRAGRLHSNQAADWRAVPVTAVAVDKRALVVL